MIPFVFSIGEYHGRIGFLFLQSFKILSRSVDVPPSPSMLIFSDHFSRVCSCSYNGVGSIFANVIFLRNHILFCHVTHFLMTSLFILVRDTLPPRNRKLATNVRL